MVASLVRRFINLLYAVIRTFLNTNATGWQPYTLQLPYNILLQLPYYVILQLPYNIILQLPYTIILQLPYNIRLHLDVSPLSTNNFQS